MTRPIGRFCISVLAFVVSYASSAMALQLDWQAPAECPSADTIFREVLRLAGTSEGNALIARAAVSQSADQRWRVAIELSGSATGHRTLTADNCAQLARASALIIALAANPDAALDLPREEPINRDVPTTPKDETKDKQPRPANTDTEKDKSAEATTRIAKPGAEPTPAVPMPAESTGTPAHPAEEPEVSNVPTPARHRNQAVALLVGTGFESGSLPTTVGWIGLGTRIRFAKYPLSAALAMRVTQGTSARFANIGIGADFREYGSQAKLCVDPASGPWFFATCAGMQLALVRVNAVVDYPQFKANLPGELMTTFTRYRWIPAPVLSLAMGYEFLPRISLELGADLVVPITHWQFEVETVGTLYRPEDRQYLLYLGLGYRLR